MNVNDYSHIQTQFSLLDARFSWWRANIWVNGHEDGHMCGWKRDIARRYFCCVLFGIYWHLSWNADTVHPYPPKSLSLEMTKLFNTTISCCSQVLWETVWVSQNILFTGFTLYMGPVTTSEPFKDTGYSKLSFDSGRTLGLKTSLGLEIE